MDEAAREFAKTLFAEHGVEEGGFVACFQLGASEGNKRWPERRFAELAALLHARKDAKIFLLGVEEEAHLGEAFLKQAPGLAIALYGKTSIPQVAAVLERSAILVTNDTGTMHIAAAVGCPITLVSVGHVHYRETGPYGEGHCAIEARRRTLGRSDYVPGGIEDRDQITAEQVLRTLELGLCDDPGAPIEQLRPGPELEQVDVYMTRFAPDGFLQFYPVLLRDMEERDFVRCAYRFMWLDYLDPKQDKKRETKSIAALLRHYSGPDAARLAQWEKGLGGVFRELSAMAQRGVTLTEKLLEALAKGKGMARAKRYVADLMALDEEARIFSELHPPCRPLILMARFERDNLEGADPLALAKTTLEIYRACYSRANLTAKKFKRIVDIWASL